MAATQRRKGPGAKGDKPASRKPASRARFGRLARWVLVASIWGAIAVGALVAWYAYDLPDISKLETQARRPSVVVMGRDDAVVATYGELVAPPVALADVPPDLVQAIVATEDRRFFTHGGVDPLGLVRAVVINIRAGTIRQGGSTLTQQLAKNLFLSPARTLRRKVQESLLALWLEAHFSKEQIFTIYFNRVYLGAGAYGFPAAAKRYFDRPLDDLNLHEAALLAGLLKAPSRYAPLTDAEAAETRARQVIANMVDAGYLSEADARAVEAQPLRFARKPAGAGARYFADWVSEYLPGYVGDPNSDLIVRTTLDARLQRAAEAALDRVLDREGEKRHVTQGALVALAPDGAVLAMVGGEAYGTSQFNRAVQALRQPGSAFKMFVYLAALEAGASPSDRLPDVPISVEGWRPHNFDGKYRGDMTLEDAFAESINTVAVQLSERTGRGHVIATARKLGITTPLAARPSIALGASEVTLLDLTAAYATIAADGRAVRPYGIASIADRRGRPLYRRAAPAPEELVDPRTARRMDAMMQRVVQSGTGRAARLDRAAAGKTGTSSDFRDAWFIGYAGDLVCGVWVGNDDSSPMKGVTGGNVPAQIWHDFMMAARAGGAGDRADR
jgi:penicillin-binding protein 1A